VAFWRNSTYSEIFFAWKPMVLLWLSSNQNDVSSLEWLIVALIPFYCSYSVLKHCALRLLVRYRSLFGCPAVLVSCLHSMFAMLTISCKHYCLYCSLAHIFVALILFARSILSCPWPVLVLSRLKTRLIHRDMCGPKGPKYAWHMRSKAPCWMKKYPAVAGYSWK
jgi:hypothetical protein